MQVTGVVGIPLLPPMADPERLPRRRIRPPRRGMYVLRLAEGGRAATR